MHLQIPRLSFILIDNETSLLGLALRGRILHRRVGNIRMPDMQTCISQGVRKTPGKHLDTGCPKEYR